MKKSKKLSSWPYTHPTWQLFAASLLFLVSVLLSRGADMHPWEVDLFLWIYDWPRLFDGIFVILTQFGSIHMFFALIIGFLLLRRYNAVVRILLTGLTAYLMTGFAKDIWGRPRPHEILYGVENLDYIVRGPGFPSGHTALAVAMALVVGRYVPPPARWVLAFLVVSVAVSRINLGIHAPLDIIGGFAIGWAAYALFCYVRIYTIRPPRKKASAVKKQKA